ncbi:MAG: hypothetical protein J5892_00125 [Bacilli bacterium]|nr:hypothetical protein [Bacilli bacterium]
MKSFFKNHIKLIFAFILGGLISSSIVVIFAISSNNITYTPPQGVSANTVANALDDLYNITEQRINLNNMPMPTHFLHDGTNMPDETSPTTTNEYSRVYLGYYEDVIYGSNEAQYGVCIVMHDDLFELANPRMHCFRPNSILLETAHLRQVFPAFECNNEYCEGSEVDSIYVSCRVYYNGSVSCHDDIFGGSCYLYTDYENEDRCW